MANLGYFAGGVAQGINAGTQIYQRMQLVQLEKQKQSIAGYAAFNNLLTTYDEDTLKALGPGIMKNVLGMDPSDPTSKAAYNQLIDKRTQMGGALRDAISSIGDGDPNNPIINLMKTVPIQSFGKMLQDPVATAGLMTQLQNFSLLRQGQKAMQSFDTGAGAAAGAVAGEVAPAAPVNATPPSVQPGAGQVPASVPMQTPVPAQAAATSAMPSATPSAISASADVTQTVNRMRAMSRSLSAIPGMKESADVLDKQATAIESNAVAKQNANAATVRAGATVSEAATAAGRLQLDKLTKLGFRDMTTDELNKHGYAPEQHVMLNPASGEQKLLDPATESIKENYIAPAAAVMTESAGAQRQLPALNTIMTLLSNSKDKTTAGPFANSRLFLARMAAALGHPDLSPNLLGRAPNTEAEQAAIAQATSLISSEMRRSMGGGAAQLENFEENLPELSQTRQGQLAITQGLIAARSRSVQAGNILLQHRKQFGQIWSRDKEGENAIDKVNTYMNSSTGVPQSLLDQLGSGGATTVARPGVTTSPAAGAAPGTLSNPITPKTQAEIDSAPPGTYFNTPAGVRMK